MGSWWCCKQSFRSCMEKQHRDWILGEKNPLEKSINPKGINREATFGLPGTTASGKESLMSVLWKYCVSTVFQIPRTRTLMLLCRTTMLVGTARSDGNINSNARTTVIIGTGKRFIGKTSAHQGEGRFRHIRKHSFVLCIIVTSTKITRSGCLQSYLYSKTI